MSSLNRVVVCNQSLETQIPMLQCTIAGGRTKGANERSFVFVHQHGDDDVTCEPSIELRRSKQQDKHAQTAVYFCCQK